MIGGALGCQHLAVAEGGSSRDMIKMPVAQQHRELSDARFLRKDVSNLGRMGN